VLHFQAEANSGGTLIGGDDSGGSWFHWSSVIVTGIWVRPTDEGEPSNDPPRVGGGKVAAHLLGQTRSIKHANKPGRLAVHPVFSPPIGGGPVLADNAVIPLERTPLHTVGSARNTVNNQLQTRPHQGQPRDRSGVSRPTPIGWLARGIMINTTRSPFAVVDRPQQRPRRLLRLGAQPGVVLNACPPTTRSSCAPQKPGQFTNSLNLLRTGTWPPIQQLSTVWSPPLRPFLAKNPCVG